MMNCHSATLKFSLHGAQFFIGIFHSVLLLLYIQYRCSMDFFASTLFDITQHKHTSYGMTLAKINIFDSLLLISN